LLGSFPEATNGLRKSIEVIGDFAGKPLTALTQEVGDAGELDLEQSRVPHDAFELGLRFSGRAAWRERHGSSS
jgi:hypothetical protein